MEILSHPFLAIVWKILVCSKTTELTKLPSLDLSSKIKKVADSVVGMFAQKGNGQLHCWSLIFFMTNK